jgi:uncharacterized membrane protein SirB2
MHGARAPLADLNRYIRESSLAHRRHEPSLFGEAPMADELPSAHRFRQAWASGRTQDQVARAAQRKPLNAGPLNSHGLVLQSLELMEELSPHYLQHFVMHVEALQWLAAGETSAAPRPSPPRQPAAAAPGSSSARSGLWSSGGGGGAHGPECGHPRARHPNLRGLSLHQTRAPAPGGPDGRGFAARSAGRLAGAEWVGSRAARTLPHLVDSLLLLSGVWMLWLLRTSPHQLPWLAAKLVGLLVYVGLGVVALREGTPRRTRWAATVLALCTVAWMVSVARANIPSVVGSGCCETGRWAA